MDLLVIRHGAAMDKDEFAESGKSDELRPLTEKGVEEMKEIAAGLRRHVKKISVLATSPLVRAVQTATIVAEEYDMPIHQATDTLSPDASLADFERWCEQFANEKIVAVVGHEPHLSSLVTWLLCGKDGERVRLRKGGACRIEFDSVARRDAGTLSWLLTPRQLRDAGDDA